MLPRIATYGLQIVSPSGGWFAGVEPVTAAAGAGATVGNGGGPAERTGAASEGVEGKGGGVIRGDSAAFDSAAGEDCVTDGTGLDVAAGSEARSSGIGCQADFASFQARSAELKLPSAILSRMEDSEKRPANCPFR